MERNMTPELDNATYARCHIDIRQAVDRYALSITRCDWEGVASCYDENATFHELPPVEIKLNGRDEIVAATKGFSDSLKSMIMMIHSCLIETDGAVAHVRTVLHETGRTKDDEDFNMFGYYSDRLVNTAGSWLVQERVFQPVQWRFPVSLRASLDLVATGPVDRLADVSTSRI